MALQYDGLDDFGNPVYSYVPDTDPNWAPSQTDIALLANVGYTPSQAADFLSGIEKEYEASGPGVAGSAGGSWATPNASLWDTVQKFLPGGTYAQKVALAGSLAGAIKGYTSGSATPQRVGYQGSIPQYTAVRQAVQGTYDPNRRPGSSGQQYFTDVQYIPKTDTAGIAAAQAAAQQQAQQMAAANTANPAKERPGMAHGGLAALAKGRYLQGTTDGMADELPASIDGREPAKLSHGEFVVPADVVSHLGNGNSDAGAKKLYSMMDKIRMARTGTKKQGKQINPDKYMPGGSVGYAEGGGIKGYAGETGSLVSGTKPTTYESNLSTWAGPYVTEMLGQGQAAAAQPYQAYQGPLTAGASGLQQQAFAGYGNLQTPAGIGQAATTAGDITKQMQGMTGAGTFATDTFGTQQAQQYMNPYLQAALDPQIAEARRQAQISNLQNMSKMTQAGAYGGGRQAIMQAEADRNLQQNLANITGQGYNTAYQQAMAQFNADQARKQQAQQFGAQYGLQALQGALGGAQAQGSLAAQQNQLGLANLGAQMQAGTAQRGIESEGIAADIKQFEEQRDYPLKMAQYMASLLPNLPLATQGSQTTTTNALQNTAGGLTTTLETLKNLGYTITPPK